MERTIKLLSLSNRYYFISFFFFLGFAGFILFYLIRYQLKEEVNEQLRSEMEHVSRSLNRMDSIAPFSVTFDDAMTISQAPVGIGIKPVLFDTIMWDDIENETIPYRMIRFSTKTNKTYYLVTIKKSEIETTDLVYSIFISFLLVFGVLGALLVITNSRLNKRLWSPFMQTITIIKTLNISHQNVVFNPTVTPIQEFKELNVSLQQMIEKIKAEYGRMKDFSENAAHEIQTPLTIIRTKLESLLQSKDLNEENAHLINQALENAVRLSKLNQTLILLTKIENNQYEQKDPVQFSTLFDKFFELYEEMQLEKELNLQVNKEDDFVYEMNPNLANILVSNLISNAVRHNIQKGFLFLNINQNGFEIINSGEPLMYPPELLFSRFTKGNYSTEHLGMGLALVKEIVEKNGLQIIYTYEHGKHTISIWKV